MLYTPEIYLQAEIAYRRERMITEISGTPIKRHRSGLFQAHRRAARLRKPTVISQAH